MHVDSEKTKLFNIYLAMQETVQCSLRETITIIIIIIVSSSLMYTVQSIYLPEGKEDPV